MPHHAYRRPHSGSRRGTILRALSLFSFSDLCARRRSRPGRGVSVLSFSLPSLFPSRLSTFNSKLSTFNPPLRLPLIAPFPQPEYPLPSRGGLGCASVRQGNGSSLELSSQQLFALRRAPSSSIKNSIPKCAG